MATAEVEVPAGVKDLGDKIAELSLKDAKALSDYLKDAYGIEPAAGGGAMMMAAPAADAGAPAAEVEVQTEFDVILEEAGPNKVQVIKAVRTATSLGLKDAKDLVDSAPKPVKEGISKEDAEALKKALEEAGAKAKIK